MKTLRIFYDTEFTSLEDVNAGLISMGLITENGDEFYAELTDTYDISFCSLFVIETVLPLLNGKNQMTFEDLAVKLKAWIESFKAKVILISDVPVVDWRFIYDLFEAHGWPQNLSKVEEPIFFWRPRNQRIFDAALDEYWLKHSEKCHHALVDATSLYFAWQVVRKAKWI
jgi:hypothetical protein